MNNACKLLAILWIIPFYCSACPSCVGAVNADSAPFFSDDCYKQEQHEQTQQQKTEDGARHE